MKRLWPLLLCAACYDVPRLSVPAETNAIAALVFAGGALVDSTPLLPIDAELPLRGDARGDTIILAFTEAELGFDLTEIHPVPTDRVEPAGTRVPTLPVPAWAVKLTAAGERLPLHDEERAALPPLRAFAPCPDFDERAIGVDLRCASFACDLRVTKRDRCDFVLDAGECAELSLAAEGRVDPRGVPEVRWSDSGLACSDAARPRPPAIAYDCERGCETDVYFQPRGPEVFFERDELELFTPPHLALPFPLDDSFVGYNEHLGRGYVLDAFVAEGGLYLAVTREDYDDCNVPFIEGELLRVDTETMALSSVAPLPACPEHLLRDPDRPGFYLMFAAGDTWSIGQYTLDGVLTASVALFYEGSPVSADGTRLGDLELRDASTGRELVVVIDERPGDDPSVEALLRVRLEDLSLLPPYLLEGRDARGAARGNNGDLLVGYARSQSVEIFGPDGARNSFSVFEQIGLFAGAPYAIPNSEVIALPVAGSLYLQDPALGPTALERAAFAERGFLLSLIAWPPGTDLLVTGGSTRPVDTPRAAIRFFELDAHRFRPGVFELGYGVAGRLLVDDEDRLWVTHPFEARVSRLRYTP